MNISRHEGENFQKKETKAAPFAEIKDQLD